MHCIAFCVLSANETLDSEVKRLEATVTNLSEENSSLVKENATLVEEKANRIAEVRQSVSYIYVLIFVLKTTVYYYLFIPSFYFCCVLWYCHTLGELWGY